MLVVFKRNLVLLLTIVLLVGCAPRFIGDADEPVTQTSAVAPASESESDLPNHELDADLLVQLLSANLAGYASDWLYASQQNYAAAVNTQDRRLARLAALLAMRASDYQLGSQAAQLWLELEPGQAAKSALIVSQLGIGNIEAAYTNLDSFYDTPIAQSIADIAAILARQTNTDAAIGVIGKFVESYPNTPEVPLAAARLAINQQQYELAENWLALALQQKPVWDEAAQVKANLLRLMGKSEERKIYIADYLATNPDSISMRISRAVDLANEEKTEPALQIMQQVVKDDQQNIAALTYTAALAEELDKDELAKQYYQAVTEVNENNDDAWWALARLAVADEQYKQAEQFFKHIQGNELFFHAQLQIANMRYHLVGLPEALNQLRALAPQTRQQYIDRATTRHFLLMQEYQYEEAFSAINETLAYLPDEPDLRYARALVAAELDEIETVEQDLKYVISLRPNNADALNALGYTLADRTTRYDEAKQLIGKALELSPSAAHILDSMGWVLYRLQDLQGAEKFLQQAYEKMPQAEVAAHLGEVLWESGQQDRAIDIWLTAFAEDKTNPVLKRTMEKYGQTPGQ